MTLWRFCPAAFFIRVRYSAICFSATIPKPPACGGRGSRPSCLEPHQNDSLTRRGQDALGTAGGTPALQKPGATKLPAAAGATPPEAAPTASEASAAAVTAPTPPSSPEQEEVEQQFAQRGQQHDQENDAEKEHLLSGPLGMGPGLRRELRTCNP